MRRTRRNIEAIPLYVRAYHNIPADWITRPGSEELQRRATRVGVTGEFPTRRSLD